MPPSTVPVHEPPRHLDFRSALQFYLIDCTTLPGKLIDILIICLNLAICAILVVETYPVPPSLRVLMWRAEMIIVVIFIIEYIAQLFGARDRVKQIRDIYSIIDLVTILPTLILAFLSASGVAVELGIIGVFRSSARNADCVITTMTHPTANLADMSFTRNMKAPDVWNYFTRSTYWPVRVSMRIFSPSLTKGGT